MSKRSRRIARFIRAAMEAYPHKRTFSAMSHYGAEQMVAVEKQHKQMELFEAELDAILNNVRRLPLQADDFFKDVWVLPCWIETKDGALWADILDKDSRGFYCRSNPSRILKPDEYGMTWRCWIGVYPSTEERASVLWGGGNAMSAFDNPVFDAVAERLEVEKQKKAYEHSNILNDPQKIDTIKGLKPHLCSNAVPRAHKGMPKVPSCKTCESQCGYGRRLIELAAAINQKTQKTKGDNLKDASQAPQDPDQNEGRLCLLLTKNQCVGVADFIEANLIDVIRNKSNIDNVNRIADIIGAMQAMRAATGTEEEA